MKKIIFTTLLYFIVTNTFSQIIKPIVNEKTKLYDYINTANNNKINNFFFNKLEAFIHACVYITLEIHLNN